ncbi:uncharacterized protein ACA1_369240 [Acanthamoeba castellanii str. Neff]|uniref:Uncharacterized protein n=1 Tax=Acanthamoeba castellanii (strain ATCC 30010 / Neff) TaxID=1257118 RepID=L8GZ25_ACACF|nr:uncharacterized protein ACA1_369240 [Acanthamoeba castellanii str. Neff]ELR18192.1 hypothetical protein ACA1_369240 [Acanthamoeba castellanii str. Neff]
MMEEELMEGLPNGVDEAAFLQARLKLFIPRRPKEPFDPYGEPESTTRKFIVQGELLKVHLLIQRSEPLPTNDTSSEGLQEPFITDSFFSRLKWEVQFQTQKFDAKLHALQSKGKGKANVTEARPKHTFGPIEELKGAGMTPNGLPDPQLTRLPTGDIMYTLHMPIALQEKYVASKLTLILALRPVAFPERPFSTLSDGMLAQMAVTSMESRSPIVRTPLSVHFARHSMDSVHYITLAAENNWTSAPSDFPQAKLAEHCLHLQNIWLQKDATKLLTTSPKSTTEKKDAETKLADMQQSMPAPLFEQTVVLQGNKSMSVSAAARKPFKLVKIDFDHHFRHTIEKGEMPLKLSVGDSYASVVTIEGRPGASGMGDAAGTLQSTIMVAWTAACLFAPILSRYDFQWPKPESPSLLLSLNAPSPAPLGQIFPVHLTLSNFSAKKVALELLVPSASSRSPSHPPLVDDISPTSPRAGSPPPVERKKVVTGKVASTSTTAQPPMTKGAATESSSITLGAMSASLSTIPQPPPSYRARSSQTTGPSDASPGKLAVPGTRPRAASRGGNSGQHRRSSSLDNPFTPPPRLPAAALRASPAQGQIARSPRKDIKDDLVIPPTLTDVGLLFCLQKTVKIGEVEANSSVRVKVDYVAGKEGVYDLKPFVVVDTITNQRYLLKHSPLIYVLPPVATSTPSP